MKRLIILASLFLGLSSFLVGQTKMQPIWVDQFNKKKVNVKILDEYMHNAAIGYESELVQGKENMLVAIKNLKSQIKSFERYRFVGRDIGQDGHIMEIGILDNESRGLRYASLTGWRKTEDGHKKETEIILKSKKVSLEYAAEIDQRRDQWMQYSNAHDPENLVIDIYTSDARYFSSGKLSTDPAEIIERYAYMKRPQWQIILNPVKTIQINDVMAFEIGTYKSSGTGQYMLIWEKSDNGIWKIIYDFNF